MGALIRPLRSERSSSNEWVARLVLNLATAEVLTRACMTLVCRWLSHIVYIALVSRSPLVLLIAFLINRKDLWLVHWSYVLRQSAVNLRSRITTLLGEASIFRCLWRVYRLLLSIKSWRVVHRIEPVLRSMLRRATLVLGSVLMSLLWDLCNSRIACMRIYMSSDSSISWCICRVILD